MNEVDIYQAIANEGNPLEREKSGPILCKDNPWLGDGYYFWDGLLSNAEWWGKTHYRGNYMIFSSSYDLHSDELFDLVGNVKHIELFRRYAMGLMRKLGLASVKVASVLEFMKQDGFLSYRAIRAEGRNAKGSRNVKFIFDDQGMYYLQPVPKFQLCIIDFSQFHVAEYRFLKYGS